jgi:hypothetical protein
MKTGSEMSDREFYLGVGTRCLKYLLQWPDRSIVLWQRDHQRLFARDYFTTELPTYYFDAYFVPRPHLLKLSRTQTQHLQFAIGQLLMDYFSVMFDDGFDWAPLRERVNDLLKTYGTSLQQIVDDNAAWISEGMPFLMHHVDNDI